MAEHQKFMKRALELAKMGEGFTSPNPAVGSVIVKNGRIVGEGYHHRAGEPHAEVEAIRDAGDQAKGATIYVTLEPCNHQGRTPPCTQAIIDAGISKVVYAVGDSNPLVDGSGHRRLLDAGLQVERGPFESEARHLNRFFFHHMATKRPYVIAKFASSLDGKIATYTGQSQWITGGAARKQGHQLRHVVDAILVGAGTAVADNPRLTTRLAQEKVSHPIRIVLDSTGRVPINSTLFDPTLPSKTIVATTSQMPSTHRTALEEKDVEVWELPTTEQGQVQIESLLDRLGENSIQSLLVEGGSEVLGTFFEEDRVQEVWAFVAPMIIGGQDAPEPVGGLGFASLAQASRLQSTSIAPVGDDFLIKGVIG